MKKRVLSVVVVTALIFGALTGCGAEKAKAKAKAGDGSGGVTKAVVAYNPTSFPLAYKDDDGNPTGYEVEVVKALDELLEDYEFEYEGVDYATEYAGIATGAYDIVLSNAFYTDERAENYNLPENFLGKSEMGIVVLNKYSDQIKGLEDIPNDWLTTPLVAGNGLTWVIDKYNEKNPDNQIHYDGYVENFFSTKDSLAKVEQGQYNFYITTLSGWKNNVVDEDGELHDEYNDKFTYIPAFLVNTYPVVAKEDTELADKVNDALSTLYENGTLVDLSEKYLGYNQFELSNTNADIDEN